MKTFYILFTVLVASSCQQNTIKYESVDIAALSQGPGDGGGGDTCNGKLIESYKLDIRTLPEYKKHITPLINRISPLQKNEKYFAFRDLISPTNKTWYLIDCKLDILAKHRKGLYLDTDQTAIQTKKEIFIDAKQFQNLNTDNKAKLLLHELLMGVYMTNEFSYADICNLNEAKAKCINSRLYTSENSFMPESSSPERVLPALTENDHQNIRALTAWLWSEKTKVLPKTFAAKMSQYGFSNLFTAFEDEVEFSLPTEAILRMFKKYRHAALPSNCQFNETTFKSTSKCEVSLTATSKQMETENRGSVDIITVVFKAKRLTDGKIFEHTMNGSFASGKIDLNKFKIQDSTPFAMLIFSGNSPIIKSGIVPKEGHRSQHLSFLLNMKNDQYPEIELIKLSSYAWYSFEEKPAEKNGKENTQVYGYSDHDPVASENFYIKDFMRPTFFRSTPPTKQLIPAID